jgi:FemAB-related protein (PEP-CTERM system-associated)
MTGRSLSDPALKLRPLDADEARWDRFVLSSSDGTFFHLSRWKRLVSDVFRHTPHYLMVTEADEIRGVLPLFEVRGWRTGRVLISVPYAVYGGICGTEPMARDTLLAGAQELAKRQGCRYVELRNRANPIPGLATREHFATFVRSLEPDPDRIFATLPGKRRNMIRRAIREGLQSRSGWAPLKEFHDVYLRNRRRLGAAPFPRRLFEAIRDRFGKHASLLTVWHRGRVVGGVISFYYGNRVLPYYAASLPATSTLAVNDYLYWELMRRSCIDGYQVFDFGQSDPGSGTWDYKRYWGFEPEPMPYQYVTPKGHDALDPVGGGIGRRTFVELWKRLPLSVTRTVGPFLIRRLPLY